MKKTLSVLLVLLISVLIVGCNKNQNSQNPNTKNNQEITKLDESKEWVYSANYEANTTATSYTTLNDEIKELNDLKAPYINVNSETAKFANENIKIIYDEAVDEFNHGLEDKITFAELDYKSNVTDKYISVLINFGVGGTDVIDPKYYSYNISLKDGSNISFQEAYKMINITDSEIDNKVEEAIKNYMINELNIKSVDDYQAYIDESINNYYASINNNDIIFYINEQKELEIMVTISIPAGKGSTNSLINIKKL